MKKLIAFLMIIIVTTTSGCTKGKYSYKTNLGRASTIDYSITIKQDILCLMMAYSGYITGAYKNANNSVYVIMKSGKKILYDDKKVKSFEEKIENPDIQDAMEQIYPFSEIKSIMSGNFAPGRIRVYDIFNEIYGASKSGVESNLMNVKIANDNYPFNRNDWAAASLNSVMKELIPIARKNATIGSYVFPISGTFNYRLIEGTNRLSPHSYGTAVDLAGNRGEYWRWTSRFQGNKDIKVYPQEIVKIFEKNNFIWGGKWGQFDMMHFEFRPEIILKSKYFGYKPELKTPWYKGFPATDQRVKKYVEIINKAFK